MMTKFSFVFLRNQRCVMQMRNKQKQEENRTKGAENSTVPDEGVFLRERCFEQTDVSSDPRDTWYDTALPLVQMTQPGRPARSLGRHSTKTPCLQFCLLCSDLAGSRQCAPPSHSVKSTACIPCPSLASDLLQSSSLDYATHEFTERTLCYRTFLRRILFGAASWLLQQWSLGPARASSIQRGRRTTQGREPFRRLYSPADERGEMQSAITAVGTIAAPSSYGCRFGQCQSIDSYEKESRIRNNYENKLKQERPLRLERNRRISLSSSSRSSKRKGFLLTMSESMSEGIHYMTLSSSGKKWVEKGGLQPIPRLDDLLGPLPQKQNPMVNNKFFRPTEGFFVTDYDVATQFVAVDTRHVGTPSYVLRAGPRESVVFEPDEVRAAIVTCGGLCPGINTVIRELVMCLWDLYDVRNIEGVKAGYRGFYSADPVKLDRHTVDDWHKRGGSVLGSSRGGFDLKKIVDGIEAAGYNQLYIIGGDGTMRGAIAIAEEIARRRLKITVTGIPKTVDNDIGIIDKSFGLDTAVEKAQAAISAGHVEAMSTPNGVGVVKLMGRNAGHIALRSTLSSRDVDCCLIPEVPFYTEGAGGLFEFVEAKIEENGHCVIVVAEGAGQELIPRSADQGYDESGNLQLLDIGTWLVAELKKWWKKRNPDKLFAVKYIDPTYMVRAVPSNAADTLFCTLLAQSAVHGAMAGYTSFVAGTVNGVYCYLPLDQIAQSTHKVDVNNHIWSWIRSINSQPDFKKYTNEMSNGNFIDSREPAGASA